MTNPFTFRCDWAAIVRPSRYNWIDFALIHASGEWEPKFGNLEFHVALLGFHLYARWQVTEGDKEFQADLDRMMREIGIGDKPDEASERPAYLADFGANNVPVEDLGAEPMGWEKAP